MGGKLPEAISVTDKRSSELKKILRDVGNLEREPNKSVVHFSFKTENLDDIADMVFRLLNYFYSQESGCSEGNAFRMSHHPF